MTESLFRRLLLRFALLPIVSLCLFLAILGLRIHQINVSRSAGAKNTAILLETSGLLQSMIDEETGIRGFLMTKDPEFLQPTHRASSELDSQLSRLTALAAGNHAREQQ